MQVSLFVGTSFTYNNSSSRQGSLMIYSTAEPKEPIPRQQNKQQEHRSIYILSSMAHSAGQSGQPSGSEQSTLPAPRIFSRAATAAFGATAVAAVTVLAAAAAAAAVVGSGSSSSCGRETALVLELSRRTRSSLAAARGICLGPVGADCNAVYFVS